MSGCWPDNVARGSKLLDAMRANPRDWRIEDVRALCAFFGVELSPPKGGGSHWKVKHPGVAHILTIPSKRPIKPVYIRDLIQFIEAARGVST